MQFHKGIIPGRVDHAALKVVRVKAHAKLPHGVAQQLPGLPVAQLVGIVLWQHAAHCLAAKGAAQKLACLLVDKRHQFQRPPGHKAGPLDGRKRLQRPHHPGHAVKIAALRYRVKMRTAEHGGRTGFLPLQPHKLVAHRVHPVRKPFFFAPAAQKLHGLLVGRLPCKPAHPSLGVCADPSNGVQPGPQPLRIDPDRLVHLHYLSFLDRVFITSFVINIIINTF